MNMNMWWILALLSGLGLAGRNILMKAATNKTDPALAAMVLSVSMAVVSIAYLVVQRVSRSEPLLPATASLGGITIAAVAGISLAAANIFLAFSYKSGGNAGVVSILQNGFSISVTILLGIILFQETMRPLQMVGVTLAMIGIILIVRK